MHLETVGWALGLSGLAVGALLGVVYYFQDNLLYYPSMPPGSRTEFMDPKEFNLSPDEVFFRTSDGLKIQAWLFRRSSSSPTMLYFHGNAGNISHRLPHIFGFWETLDVNIMIVSYRGYGKSEGVPSEAGMKLDADAAVEFLLHHPEIDSKKLFVHGESLGGAVAIYLASVSSHRDKIRALLLENTFTSIVDMISVVFPVLRHVSFLSRNKWESTKLIGDIKCPIGFLSGERDELVPPRQMAELYRLAVSAPKKTLSVIPKGRHNDTWLKPGYYDAAAAFLKEIGLVAGPARL